MKKAENVVYITDNCGEIVLDKIAIQILKKIFPNIRITALVRGLPAGNDATMEDAEFCGLTDVVPVLGNGNDVGGTWLHGISTHARELLYNADVIIAKGQGNYETLLWLRTEHLLPVFVQMRLVSTAFSCKITTRNVHK